MYCLCQFLSHVAPSTEQWVSDSRGRRLKRFLLFC